MDNQAELTSRYIRGTGIEIGYLHRHIKVPANVDLKYVNSLNNIGEEQIDFCICNSVLEYTVDPINAFENWLRILKPGGILYLSVLDISNPLDSGRELTTSEYFHNFNKSSLDQFFSQLTSILKDSFQILESADNEIGGVKEYIFVIEKTNYFDKIFALLKFGKNQQCNQSRCDVIIPVYNAYFDFIKCLYSTIKYQNKYRIICINDKSTDPRIDELFLKIKPWENENLILLKNPTNSGFVKTVNKGMKYSKNDVILLNSDTIVTNNWTAKLANCAYSNERIATVTPFSNNATICSIPKFCQDNIVPEGFTVDAFADFVEKISLKQFPELPTAVGFCMYIKRSAIEEIGYFDEATFGKGYGEENDFCMRVIKAGYRNVLCDDTFIFHKGAASFSGAQTELMKNNLKILSERYPDYFPDVAKFCQLNPLTAIQENIKLRMFTWDTIGKKRILFILHHLGGGTENHVIDLIESLKSEYIYYILKVENNQMVLTEFNNSHTLNYIFQLPNSTGLTVFYDRDYKRFIHIIINTFHISLIHIHHLLLHTLDIFDVAKEQNIPIFMTLHDYYTVCPSINLLDEKYEYCHNKNCLEKCNRCLSKRSGLPINFIKQWREYFQNALNKSDLLIAPSPSVFEILKNYYHFSDNKTLVIEHGHKEEILKPNNISPDSDKIIQTGKFHVAYIGSLANHKGSKVFYAMALSKKMGKNIKWSIFGKSDLHHTRGYDKHSNIYIFGKYNNLTELKLLLKSEKVDLVFLPSIWPETFSYTLSEAWASGIPVLVSDMGALRERVERNGGGWTVDVSDLNKVEDKIIDIIRSPEDYSKKKEDIRKIQLKKFDEMQKEYSEIYSKYILLSKPIYIDQSILSNYEIYKKIYNSRVQIKQPNLFIKSYECFRENGLIYTLRKGYSYLHSFLNFKA